MFEFIPCLGAVKFASQICHENINKPLDGAYLTDFGIDISLNERIPWVCNAVGIFVSEKREKMTFWGSKLHRKRR